LTAEEWVVMKRHPNLGLEVLEKIGGMEGVKEVVWSHHERLDGSGYPRGLKADAISIAVRIIAVADTYDCMTSERPYHMAVGTEKALKKIHAERKDTLDPKCVEALEKVLAGNSKLYLPSLAEMPFFVGERRVGVFNRRWQGETERRTRLGLPEIETL
jgi:HD-GYP domain-containing protein (c-di-GMP phosphodiesterase class II)